MTDNELPGMWENSDLHGGEADGWSNADTHRDRYPRSEATSPEAEALEETANRPLDIPATLKDGTHAEHMSPDHNLFLCQHKDCIRDAASARRLPVRMADAAQYPREAIPPEQRGQIRVRLLNAMPDPYGSVAALCAQYSGKVIRDLSEVTDAERRSVIDDMLATVLNGPLEVAQFHFQIEGVTRAITHQMVRSRASFFAQESLRFAVPEGDWRDEVPYPPSLAGERDTPKTEAGRNLWRKAMMDAQYAYQDLIAMGIPAEEARGVLPHDMPTRIHWVLDLRTLLTEAGKRTCTQAQFPWRMIFAGMAKALRERGKDRHPDGELRDDGWQFVDIANRLRPVCFQTGSCGFMAKFDRSCSIRSRVDAFAAAGVPSSGWGERYQNGSESTIIEPIYYHEWAANPAAARS